MPLSYREYWSTWQQLNPDAILKTWTESEVFDRTWTNQQMINTMIKESQKPDADLRSFYTHVADTVCQEILYELGGLYVNCDMQPVKPLHHLDLTKPGFAMEDDVHAVNMAMWSPRPGEQVFKDIIDSFPNRYFRNPGALMNYSTGALAITPIVKSYRDRVTLWHRDVWNPVHFDKIPYGTEYDFDSFVPPPETVAYHHWGHRNHNRHSQRILEGGW